jgi:protein phosphatase
MPWSAKAQDLIRDQYAAVGAAARASLGAALDALRAADVRGVALDGMLARFERKAADIDRYIASYRR